MKRIIQLYILLRISCLNFFRIYARNSSPIRLRGRRNRRFSCGDLLICDSSVTAYWMLLLVTCSISWTVKYIHKLTSEIFVFDERLHEYRLIYTKHCETLYLRHTHTNDILQIFLLIIFQFTPTIYTYNIVQCKSMETINNIIS